MTGGGEPTVDLVRGDAARAARAERSRLDEIAAELARGGPVLDERRRATVTRMLDQMLVTAEDELRQRLAEQLRPDFQMAAMLLESTAAGLTRTLVNRTGLLADPDLLAVIVRRADEHVLATAVASARPHAVLEDLVASANPAVASAALGVIVGEARRLDSFREPMLARTDLPAELQHRLVWRTAAALRTLLTADHGVPVARADTLVGEVAYAELAGYDEEDRLEARARLLAHVLAAADLLHDELIVALFRAGHPVAAVAGLALRASLPFAAAWDRLLAPDNAEAAQLLAAASLDRQSAADLLLALHGADRLAAGVARFEAEAGEEAWSALGLWRMDEVYRRAVIDLVDRRRRP